MNVEYPAHREADVALRDGSTVHVRPARGEDHDAMLEFLRELSPDSRMLRFFTGSANLEWAAERMTEVDYRDRVSLVATAGAGDRIVAHATYIKTAPERAEVAFAIADALQGRGLGTILLGQLAEMAEENGIRVFEAQVLPNNRRMIDVFRESGFPVSMRSEPGTVIVEFPASLTEEALERFDRREQTAAAAAMERFFRPRSVAVIGASRNRGGIAGEVFHNLLEYGFNGPVYPVNPKAGVVQSVPAYPSVIDVPGPVDLAVVVVPAPAVVEVARECAAKGVGALVVISSGFAEVGEEGRALQRDLVAVCRSSGMRLIGPNCMGIVNTDPDVRLNATFAPDAPMPGRVGFLSQSGALGLAVIDRASALGLGLSSFVSVGNKADISGNDLINYWEADEGTDLVLLYLESFGNPRKFSRITRRVGKRKPIVAVKSGRSQAGARATTSHTGALIAASDVTVDALFRQAGVIRTDSLAEMFDVASLLANQPPAAGRRVGIITNAGGPGILCADACEGHGLEVPPLPEEVQRELAGFLPPEAALWNPVDMIASATDADYRRTIEVVANRGGVDALIVIFIPPLVTRASDVGAAVRAAVVDLGGTLPVLSVFMSSAGPPAELAGEGARIPAFAFPEEAAAALARAVDYGRWKSEPEGAVPAFPEVLREEAAAAIATALARDPGWLPPDEVASLLSCYGLPLAEWRLADSAAAAGRAARELGGPVALKAVAPTLVHKTEARGVRLSLRGPTRVTAAAREMAEEVGAAGHRVERFLVQRMVEGGVEMLVGMVHDPVFGPVVACGAGGVAVELTRDVAVRITPLTDLDAGSMVRSLATFPLLDGYRGAPKADVAALEDILLRVSALVENHPEVAEMDCNPVKVLTEGAVIVDARVRIEVPVPRPPLGARRT
ncbi:MAG: GNAT family N-acetyltransferase [Actinomycetota bacterium]|nr:GNAT family N-acetyltransferase [Actinomycetota bacterium]